MSDHRGLIGKLMQLAATDTPLQDGWRQIGRALDRDPLAAMLREIDETQLPRKLSFRNDQGHTLCLEAGNRRLRRIMSVSWSDAGAVAELLEKELSRPTDAEVEAIGAAFRTVQPGDQTVWVRSEELTTGGEGAPNGLLVAALAEAFSVDIDDRSDENLRRAFEDVVTALTLLSDAWVRIEDGAVAGESDPEPGADWRAAWESVDMARFQNGSGPARNAPELCILGSGTSGEPHHFVATYGTTSVVALVKATDVIEIAQTWRDHGL